MHLGSLITTLGVDTRGLDDARRDMSAFANSVEGQSRKAKTSLEKVGEAMKDVGQDLSLYVTAPMMLVGTGSFKMAKDFEKSMSLITGLVGISADQVDAWKKDILEMAPELGKSPQELAQGLYFVTSAGIKGAEAMEVLEMSAKAAASGLGETEAIANLVTSAMNAYGVENLSASEATDILVTAVREGKAEASALAGSMSMVLPIAAEMGLSFDQVGAAQAAMTRTGASASEAATQLRGMLVGMLNPAEQSQKALAEMGMSFEDLRSQIREKGLIATLTNLRQVVNDNGKEISDIFPDVRALTGVLDLTGSSAESNIAVFDALKNSTGALEFAFETASKTAEQQWQEALAGSQVALIRLGDVLNQVFIPILQWATKAMTSLAEWFSNLSVEGQRLVLGIGALVTALGPMLIAVGFMAESVIPTLVDGLKLTGKGLVFVKNKLIALKVVMLKNPFTAVAVGIAAVAAAILLMRNNAKEAVPALDAVTEAMNKLEGASKTFGQLKRNIGTLGAMDLRQTQAFQQSIEAAIQQEQDAILNYQTIIKGYGERELEFAKEWLAKREESFRLWDASHNAFFIEGNIGEANRLDSLRKQLLAEIDILEGQMTGATLRILTDTDERSWAQSLDRLAQLNVMMQEVQTHAKSLEIKSEVEVIIPEDPMKGLLAALASELEFISKMSDALGVDFDASAARAQAFGNTLQEALRLPGVDVANKHVQELLQNLNSLQVNTERLATDEVFKDMNKELAIAAQLYSLQGDTLEWVTSNIGVQQSAVERLVETWAGMEMPEDVRMEIENLLTAIEALNKEQERVNLQKNIEGSLHSLEEQIALIEWRAKIEGHSFDVLSEKANAYQGAMLQIASMDLSAEQLDELANKWRQARDASEEYQLKAEMANILTQNMASGFFNLGEAIGTAMAEGAEGMDIMKAATISMGNTLLDILQQTVNMMLVKALAGLIAGEVSTKGVLGLATAAIGVGVLKAMWQQHVGSMPRAYKGAIAHGDTAIRVGDYAGASSINPEVIAPLSDLKNYLGNAGGGVARIDLRVAGPDLYAVWEKEHAKRKNNR